jgi:hypothetical protein
MAFNSSVLDVYRHFFAARLDVYSHWTADGWRPVREEMTVEILADGLSKKGPAISGYMIAPGNKTHVAALDIDMDEGMAMGRTIINAMRSEGAAGYLEASRRGAHVWMVLERVTPARAVRSALNHWLDVANMPKDPASPAHFHPKIELRPATDSINADGLGHCLRMPLMPHPLTGQRFRLESTNGDLGLKLSDILLEIELVPHHVVENASMKWVPVIDHVPRDRGMPKPPRKEDDSSASEILRTLWGLHEASPGKVFSCPAKEYHSHNDIHKGMSILPDDKRAMCHKPGCILNNDGRGRGTWELRTMAPRHG